jgi:MFS family permease
MQASLHASFVALQRVIDGYTLALSALLLTAGSLGDRYGRRRLYLAGIAVFTIGSAVCAASGTTGLLVADPDHAATDPAGQAASIVWLGALTFGLIQAGIRRAADMATRSIVRSRDSDS